MAIRKSGTRGKNVKVKPYTRVRFGNTEHVKPHKRGPRSKTPGGYVKRNWSTDHRRKKFR